jgi:hypothetical protein
MKMSFAAKPLSTTDLLTGTELSRDEMEMLLTTAATIKRDLPA